MRVLAASPPISAPSQIGEVAPIRAIGARHVVELHADGQRGRVVTGRAGPRVHDPEIHAEEFAGPRTGQPQRGCDAEARSAGRVVEGGWAS